MGVLPGAPSYAALVQLQETLRLERRGWGWKSLTRHQFQFAHVVQRRDGALKTRTVSVRDRPWAAPAACSPIAEAFRSRRKGCRCKSCHAGPLPESESGAGDSGLAISWLVARPQVRRPERQHHFGMSTGRASRASVLTSACLWASGASPRHSANFACGHGGRAQAPACSSKRTVRLINGIGNL